jgi:hypothetical protein
MDRVGNGVREYISKSSTAPLTEQQLKTLDTKCNIKAARQALRARGRLHDRELRFLNRAWQTYIDNQWLLKERPMPCFTMALHIRYSRRAQRMRVRRAMASDTRPTLQDFLVRGEAQALLDLARTTPAEEADRLRSQRLLTSLGAGSSSITCE